VNRRNYLNTPARSRDYTGRSNQRTRIDNAASTHCESAYLHSLAQAACELVFVLRQGDQITGYLNWYDESCLKVTPSDGSPHLLIPKGSLKYLYELSEVDSTK
jgi:hypothetical protein